MKLTDAQKHAIIEIVLSIKALWLAGASQEQAAGTRVLRAMEGFEQATEAAYNEPQAPDPEPQPAQPVEEPATATDPSQPATEGQA